MAPSKETSCEGSLPTVPPTPVKLIVGLLRDLSIKEDTHLTPIDKNPDGSDSTPPSTPTPDIANIATRDSLQARISEAITKLLATEITNLLTDKPLLSSLKMPAAVIQPIQALKTSPNLLAIEPNTKKEVLLLGALQEVEECCEAYKQRVITLQAQAVLNEAYCNKLHFQLAFQEEKKKNPGAPGKLVEDGLPRLLSGDEFDEKVVEFTKWQKEKEVQKETRQAEREELKAANDEWKKNEAKRKVENVARRERFHAAKSTWQAKKQEARAAKQKFTKPEPKLGVLLKALPKPMLPAEEEENGEELDDNDEESASSDNDLAQVA
ncbi:hypothetical protein PAXRUDRAFT_136881 [Paxillus rubicundulus Ve08.2h10]|uniref:Uncharacterized protein n=1 Tax=Paxillus rubicundulus Ve08.2h10 TaxID=930991 RepID=A0A0D0EB49_9AGAM|nr:hypothetical protein PAXRUDRAFT_136881 [Paxillus rubicundulus Ve08.2h10]